MQLKVKKLIDDAIIPKFALSGDAGLDIYSISDYCIEPWTFCAVDTGIAMEIPVGYVGLVWDKSGVAIKNGIKILGGVVDASYRGEIKIGLVNLSDKNYVINKGDKVAQMLIQKFESPEIIEATELSDSERGAGAFGSTGKK